MGENIYCDNCSGGIVNRQQATPIIIGEHNIADYCYKCVTDLKGAMQKRKVEIMNLHTKTDEPDKDQGDQVPGADTSAKDTNANSGIPTPETKTSNKLPDGPPSPQVIDTKDSKEADKHA